jgi:serine/threonine protein kinase
VPNAVVGLSQELAGSPANRIEELNDDFTVYMEGRKDDSIVSKMTGAGRTVANQYSMFQEDSPSGKPFANFYKKGDTLGEGGFATVYRCTHKRTGFKYAVKEINSSELSQQEAATLKEEILALQYLRGAPYIIRLYDVFKEPQRTYLILEEMKGGTLLQRIAEKEVYTELEARDLCKILFLAVDYCHKKRIAHRDIKLENLLLVEAGDDSTIKLADFGFAKKCTKAYGLKTMCGTPNYMAPEIFDLKIKGYDHRCDMWSVGVVVFCVLGGYLPFEGKLRDLQKLVIRGEYQFHEMWWKDVSHKAKDLIRCLLQTQPERRYSAEQALAAPWMQLDDGELVYKDLSSTQERMKMMARKKFKNAVNTVSDCIGLRNHYGQGCAGHTNFSTPLPLRLLA